MDEKNDAEEYHCGDDDLTFEQVSAWALYRALLRPLQELLYPSIVIRNLTENGWWKGKNRNNGDVEIHIEDNPGFDKISKEADHCAIVALDAIKAYRAYVAAGGDASKVPEVSFKDGVFSVVLVDRNAC